MITDLDVGLSMGPIFLGMILWFIKSSIHFDYLKQEKGKFKDVESLKYVMFRPIYFLVYLPETFVILNVPILWNLKKNTLRRKVGLLSYCALSLWTFAIIYISWFL